MNKLSFMKKKSLKTAERGFMERDWKEWIRAALIRAVRTFAQALATLIGAKDIVSIIDIDWSTCLGIAATMAVMSILTSLAGLPEVPKGCANGLGSINGNDEIDPEAKEVINGI